MVCRNVCPWMGGLLYSGLGYCWLFVNIYTYVKTYYIRIQLTTYLNSIYTSDILCHFNIYYSLVGNILASMLAMLGFILNGLCCTYYILNGLCWTSYLEIFWAIQFLLHYYSGKYLTQFEATFCNIQFIICLHPYRLFNRSGCEVF